jgi:hypothetical protein
MKPLLAACALLIGAGAGAATAARTDAKFAELEQRYAACNQAAMTRLLGFGEAAQCSMIYERLLRERFDGDFERLLQWSRSIDQTAASARTPFETAQAHYDAGRFAEAYDLFARLADCGHREAARIALQMRRVGPQLYGVVFDATPQRLARWQAALSTDSLDAYGSCTAA